MENTVIGRNQKSPVCSTAVPIPSEENCFYSDEANYNISISFVCSVFKWVFAGETEFAISIRGRLFTLSFW